LLEQGLVESREKAKAIIMEGLVEVDGVRIDKPGHPTPRTATISVKKPAISYVSRGGLKLEAALRRFSPEIKERVVMDVGSSTGGFTDCLLQHGARKVMAVDVGYGQFHWKLRQDPRVVLLEKTNIRFLRPEDLEERPYGATIDVSFISLRLVLPAVSEILGAGGWIIALVKPQFEVGRGQVGKGGVVRDPDLHREVVERIKNFCQGIRWGVRGEMESPLLGPKGNKEFLLYLEK
jgi:23S rRNA (cytidine1920-2'-O)/16S rRNA (cytidine1409-2'-O)-methyltransferase